MFALVDGNNFYASCERVFNPALNNKPVEPDWEFLAEKI